MKWFFILCTAWLILTGCQSSELFSEITTSEVEQSAAQKIEQSDAIREKISRIETKKNEFAEFVELGVIDPNIEAAAVAYRNDFSSDQQSIIDIEAVLPQPIDSTYTAWLSTEGNQAPLKLGEITSSIPDDYMLTYETKEDLTDYRTIIITKEKNDDQEPEERILVGQFSSP